MAERTELEKVLMMPIKVTFGDKEFDIKPLPVKKALPWVTKVVAILNESMKLTMLKVNLSNVQPEDITNLQSATQTTMIDNPQKMIDLLFEYAPDLKREEVENVASSAQLMAAFEQCLELEKPFLKGMTRLRAISQ